MQCFILSPRMVDDNELFYPGGTSRSLAYQPLDVRSVPQDSEAGWRGGLGNLVIGLARALREGY